MISEKWERIISLVKKTGEKVVVFDENEGSPLVVMPFDQYEKEISGKVVARGLTEDEMLDRINQDITHWQALQEENMTREISVKKDKDEDEERYYVEPVE